MKYRITIKETIQGWQMLCYKKVFLFWVYDIGYRPVDKLFSFQEEVIMRAKEMYGNKLEIIDNRKQ